MAEWDRLLRFCLLLIFGSFFVREMIRNTQDLFSGQTIIVSENKKINDVKNKPKITICAPDQLNTELLKENGFGGFADLFAGIKKGYDDGLTWRLNENSTLTDFLLKVFAKSTDVLTQKVHIDVDNIALLEPNFDIDSSKGVCVEIIDYEKEITIKTSEAVIVYLVDPSVDLKSLKENHGHIIETTKEFKSRSYDVTIQERVVYDKTTCNDYDEEYTMLKCYVQDIAELTMTELSCVPQWVDYELQNNYPKCPDVVANVSKSFRNKLFLLLKEYMNSRYDQLKACKKSCFQTDFQVNLISITGALRNESFVRIYMNENIEHNIQKAKYDVGTYLIALGGSLSLWLNLSFLGIYDLLTDTGIFTKLSGFFRVGYKGPIITSGSNEN